MADCCKACRHKYCVECDPTCPRCGHYNEEECKMTCNLDTCCREPEEGERS